MKNCVYWVKIKSDIILSVSDLNEPPTPEGDYSSPQINLLRQAHPGTWAQTSGLIYNTHFPRLPVWRGTRQICPGCSVRRPLNDSMHAHALEHICKLIHMGVHIYRACRHAYPYRYLCLLLSPMLSTHRRQHSEEQVLCPSFLCLPFLCPRIESILMWET